MVAYLFLFGAIAAEVCATSLLKSTHGFTAAFLGEAVTVPTVVGCALIIAGVVTLNLSGPSH